MYKFFVHPFMPMEKRMMPISSICFVLLFTMPCLSGERIFMKAHPICKFEELEAAFCKCY
jgi:hypothetical protein